MCRLRIHHSLTISTLSLALIAGAAMAGGGSIGKKLYKENVNGVVAVYLKSGDQRHNGTGWVVDTERKLVVTNHHVVPTQATAFIAFPAFKDGQVISDPKYYTDKTIHGRVIDTDPRRDLAVIQLDYMPKEAVAFKLGDSASPGERVHLIGHPGASRGLFVYSTGVARQIVHMKAGFADGQKIDCKTLESTMASNPGDSGSGVFNDDGEIVGVHSSSIPAAQLMSSHVEVSELKTYLSEVRALLHAKTATAAAYHARGKRNLDRRQNDKAIADQTMAIKLDPKFANAYISRAEVYVNMGAFDQAVTDASQALNIDPNSVMAHVMRGRAKVGKRLYDDAVTDFSKAIDLQPDYAPAYYQRGVAYNRKGNSELAIFNYNEAIKQDSTYADAFHDLGRIYFSQGDYDKSIQHHTAALRVGGPNVWYYNLRGDAFFAKKMYNDAMRDYQDSIKVDPSFAIGYADVGRVFANDRQYDKALNFMDQAIKIDAKCDYAFWHRAATYERLGMIRECTRDYEEAARLNSYYADKTKMHDRCYLNVANKTNEKIRVYVRYEAEVEGGTWKWFGGTGDNSLFWDIEPGRVVYLNHDNWKIRARRIQISAEGHNSGNRSQTQTAWMCQQPYRAQAIADYIYTFK